MTRPQEYCIFWVKVFSIFLLVPWRPHKYIIHIFDKMFILLYYSCLKKKLISSFNPAWDSNHTSNILTNKKEKEILCHVRYISLHILSSYFLFIITYRCARSNLGYTDMSTGCFCIWISIDFRMEDVYE